MTSGGNNFNYFPENQLTNLCIFLTGGAYVPCAPCVSTPLHTHNCTALSIDRFLPRDARSATRCCCRSSIRPSVRPSVMLRYRGRIGWTSSKVITRVISLESSLLGASPRRTPQNLGGIGVVSLFSAENLLYL